MRSIVWGILLGLTSIESFAVDITRLHFVNGCRILSYKAEELKTFPGLRCVFLENGDYVTSDEQMIRYFDKDKAEKWNFSNTYLHHQLNLSPNNDELLVLGSMEEVVDGKKVRNEELIVLRLSTGEVLKRQSGGEILKQAHLSNPPKPFQGKSLAAFDLEQGHFNSFYQIPKQSPKVRRPPYIREGHYVLNGIGDGVFILSNDLKTVLHHFTLPSSRAHRVHDVQVTDRGTYLLFNNDAMGGKVLAPFSQVEEVTTSGLKSIMKIGDSLQGFFYSDFCGSVQELDRTHVLLTHLYSGAFIYNRKSKSLDYANHRLMLQNRLPHPTQQIKAFDLTKFLVQHSQTR